jgi:hypothetical protein
MYVLAARAVAEKRCFTGKEQDSWNICQASLVRLDKQISEKMGASES